MTAQIPNGYEIYDQKTALKEGETYFVFTNASRIVSSVCKQGILWSEEVSMLLHEKAIAIKTTDGK